MIRGSYKNRCWHSHQLIIVVYFWRLYKVILFKEIVNFSGNWTKIVITITIFKELCKLYYGIQGVLATYHTQLEASRTGVAFSWCPSLFIWAGWSTRTRQPSLTFGLSVSFFLFLSLPYTYVNSFDAFDGFTWCSVWHLTKYIMCCLKKKLYR